MTTVVSCWMMLGIASGSSTRRMICTGVAPIESAASTRPYGTSVRLVSTCRPMNGMAAMTSGTIAAVVPIALPTTRRVNGMMATMRMMNGMERTALTTPPTALLSAGASRMPPFFVVCSSTPSGTPRAVAIIIETATI